MDNQPCAWLLGGSLPPPRIAGNPGRILTFRVSPPVLPPRPGDLVPPCPAPFLFFSFCFVCVSGVGVFWAVSVAEFSNRDDMSRAVRELDDTYFADRRIRVDYVSTRLFVVCFGGLRLPLGL